MFDPLVPSSNRHAMHRLKMAVAHGAVFYVAGKVAVGKVQKLVHSFDHRFGLSASSGRRDYARKCGRATFQLHLYPLPNRTDFAFWLLRHEGDHPQLATEKWLDARTSPMRWHFRYELRRIPVPPDHRAHFQRRGGAYAIGDVTWTWRIQRDEMNELRYRIKRFCTYHDARKAQLLRDLSFSPNERGARHDVFVLRQYLAAQCHANKIPVPDLPSLFWRVGSAQVFPLSSLCKRFDRGAESWFPAHVPRDTAPSTIPTETPNASA